MAQSDAYRLASQSVQVANCRNATDDAVSVRPRLTAEMDVSAYREIRHPLQRC